MTEVRLLVVDDEPSIRDLLASSLRFAGYGVSSVGNDTEALRLTTTEKSDLMILDIILPDMDGFTVIRKLRAAEINMPILFLIARDDMHGRVGGPQAGGNDYVAELFRLKEAMTRISAILRRTKHGSSEQPLLQIADLELDDNLYEMHRNRKLIDLSPTKFKPLRHLMINREHIVSKSQIFDHAWEYDREDDAAIVESYISYLRRKLDVPSKHGNISPSLVQTRHGVGYLLHDPDEQSRSQSPMVAKMF